MTDNRWKRGENCDGAKLDVKTALPSGGTIREPAVVNKANECCSATVLDSLRFKINSSEAVFNARKRYVESEKSCLGSQRTGTAVGSRPKKPRFKK